MLDVYDFLNTFTDLCGCIVTIFDCDSEKVVFNADEKESYNPVWDIQEADLDGYDVASADLFIDNNGKLHLELNISMGDEQQEG